MIGYNEGWKEKGSLNIMEPELHIIDKCYTKEVVFNVRFNHPVKCEVLGSLYKNVTAKCTYIH